MTSRLASAAQRSRLMDRVRDWLGSECAICRRHQRARLCAACVRHLAAPVLRCGVCGLRTAEVAADCPSCRFQTARAALDATVVAVDYQPPWDELVTRLKSAHEVDLVPALARLLLAAVRQAGSSGAAADTPACVIPVPLRPARLRARGYNQAALLAQPVACACGLPVLGQALVRVRDTRTQHGLDRAARLRNLRLAFEVPAAMRPMVSGQRIALVDDVMTTGATLEAAALALKCAGAAHVQAWVLARTPAPDL